MDSRPVLWQLQISHYNEKVRWALDYKRIPHVRRSLVPGLHKLKTWQLARSLTTPVLTLNGTSIGDSTRIIAALEELLSSEPEPSSLDVEIEFRDPAQPGDVVLLGDPTRLWITASDGTVHASIVTG